MNVWKAFVFFAAAGLVVISCSRREPPLSRAQPPSEQNRRESIENERKAQDGNHKAGEILVKFGSSVAEERIKEILTELHLEKIRLVSPPSLYLLRIPPGSSVQDVIERIERFEEVEYAEPNYILKIY